jgi:hypothetical protein
VHTGGAVTWPTAPVEFSLSSSQPEDATARGIPTFPELGTKRSPSRPGAELEETDFSGNEKGRQPVAFPLPASAAKLVKLQRRYEGRWKKLRGR